MLQAPSIQTLANYRRLILVHGIAPSMVCLCSATLASNTTAQPKRSIKWMVDIFGAMTQVFIMGDQQ
jgi:hypothetical protein